MSKTPVQPSLATEESANQAKTVQPKTGVKAKELKAEVTFDKAVYGGISYGAQAVAGTLATNWFEHGGGKPYGDKAAEWAGNKLFSSKTLRKLFKLESTQAAVKFTREPIIVAALVMVGNMFLFPVKWIEDRKPEIVSWINDRNNKKLEAKGYTLTDEERAAQETRLKQIEQEPKQNWRSLGLGRLFALGAVFSTVFALNRTPKINNKSMENVFTSSTLKITDAIGLKKLSKSKGMENITRIAFYDIFYSMISAGGLYVYSHFIEPPKDKKKCPAPTAEDCKKLTATSEQSLPNDEPKPSKNTEKLEGSFVKRVMSQEAQNSVQQGL